MHFADFLSVSLNCCQTRLRVLVLYSKNVENSQQYVINDPSHAFVRESEQAQKTTTAQMIAVFVSFPLLRRSPAGGT